MTYPISNINKISKDHSYFVLVNSHYYESSGYEQQGEIGSRCEYIEIYSCSEKELPDIIKELHRSGQQKYQVVRFTPCEVKTTIQIEVK